MSDTTNDDGDWSLVIRLKSKWLDRLLAPSVLSERDVDV
jgi:hypothetical protein